MNFNINEKLVDKIDPETINKEIIIIKDIEAKLDEEIKIASREKSDIKFIAGIIFGSAIFASLILLTLAESVGIDLVCKTLLILWVAVAVIDTLLILCTGSHIKEIEKLSNNVLKNQILLFKI